MPHHFIFYTFHHLHIEYNIWHLTIKRLRLPSSRRSSSSSNAHKHIWIRARTHMHAYIYTHKPQNVYQQHWNWTASTDHRYPCIATGKEQVTTEYSDIIRSLLFIRVQFSGLFFFFNILLSFCIQSMTVACVVAGLWSPHKHTWNISVASRIYSTHIHWYVCVDVHVHICLCRYTHTHIVHICDHFG